MNESKPISNPPGRVLYIQFNNAAALPPLEHSAKILARRGWNVLILGAGQQSVDALCFEKQSGIEVRMMPYCQPGWRQKLHYFKFCLWISAVAVRWKPRWIYASDLMACPAALMLTMVHRWNLLYHEHDFPAHCQVVKPSAFIKVILWTRRQVARRAAFCVVPNSGRTQAIKASTATRRPLLAVWNCPERDEALTARGWDRESNSLVLYYHGSIVPARLPMNVLRAMASVAGRMQLRVAGYETNGHPGYVARLKAEATRLGIGHCFEYLGPIPRRADLLAACRQADVGLALMPMQSPDVNEQTMAGASNKPFDYLASGVAVLVSDLPDWKKMFVEPGYGLACNPSDVSSITTALRQFIEEPDRRRLMGERGRERIRQEWNFETQFAPVLEKLDRL